MSMYLPQKLPKFLSDRTTLPVREIERACDEGRVRLEVEGRLVLGEPQQQYVFAEDAVYLDDEPIVGELPRLCYVLNKPKSVTVTAADPRGKRDLGAWLSNLPQGVFPVGRLDRATTGVLLLTNDGDLASAMTRPEHCVKKTYWLWLNECLLPGDPRLARWFEGMTILGRKARADDISVLASNEDMCQLLVSLSQGINRQIRRMCRATDLRLLHLHRRAIGPVTDQGLALGTCRQLSAPEVDALWAQVGGQEAMLGLKLRALEQAMAAAREAGRPLLRLEAWFARHARSYEVP